jgi:hypothetical protein
MNAYFPQSSGGFPSMNGYFPSMDGGGTERNGWFLERNGGFRESNGWLLTVARSQRPRRQSKSNLKFGHISRCANRRYIGEP